MPSCSRPLRGATKLFLRPMKNGSELADPPDQAVARSRSLGGSGQGKLVLCGPVAELIRSRRIDVRDHICLESATVCGNDAPFCPNGDRLTGAKFDAGVRPELSRIDLDQSFMPRRQTGDRYPSRAPGPTAVSTGSSCRISAQMTPARKCPRRQPIGMRRSRSVLIMNV